MKLYTGKSSTVESILNELLSICKGVYHHLYIDNFCTTISGIDSCMKKNMDVTGTCRVNRKDLPKDLIKAAKKILKKGEMIISNNSSINCISLHDKKFLVLLSTRFRVTENEFTRTKKTVKIDNETFNVLLRKEKIHLISSYNNNMNGVDILDQKLQYYDINRRSTRWTFKLSIGIVNIF